MFKLVLQQIGYRIVAYLLLTLFRKRNKERTKVNQFGVYFPAFSNGLRPLNRVNRLTQVRLIAGLTVSLKLLSLEANVYSTDFCSQPSTIFLICVSFEFKQLLSATGQKYADTTTKQMIYFELKDHKALHFQ